MEQPFKIPFVAAIVLFANLRKAELAGEVLARACKKLQMYLAVGAWREVKLVLRFLGCLQGLFEGDGVFPILEDIFSRAVDLQTASSEDVSISPIIIFALLTTVNLEPRIGTCQDHTAHNTICHGFLGNRL